MRIDDIKGPTKKLNIDVKVIYDLNPPKNTFGKMMKTIIVVDADLETGGTTALMDLVGKDITKYKKGDKIRVVDGYGKIVTTHRKGLEVLQPLITYGFAGNNLLGHYEALE